MLNKNLQRLAKKYGDARKPILVERPQIELLPMGSHVFLNIKSQKEYDNLMQIYELGDWTWISGKYPTNTNHYFVHKRNTCINIGPDKDYGKRRIRLHNLKDLDMDLSHIIKTPEFFGLQGINIHKLNQANIYFEYCKPNRKSKGN